jgi:hypothetical protein
MTHFKLKASAAAVALALCSQANAFTDPATATVRLYLSGASAPTHMLREQVVQNLCASDIDVFVDQVNQAPGAGGTPVLNAGTYWTVQCIGGPGPALNQRLLIAKTDVGGSAQGVNPVALGNSVGFLNTALCAGGPNNAVAGDGTTAYRYRICGTANLHNQVPDMGISDIEPDKFTGALNDPLTGDFLNPPPNWQVETGPGLVFGVVVTTSFRNELQTDQIARGLLPAGCLGQETEACMPDLPAWYVRSVFANRINNWNTEEVLGSVINVPAGFNTRVHICRRVQGSGTHAQHMIQFARTNCNRAATLPMPGQPGGTFGAPFVFENSSSGNMDNCLSALESGAGTTAPTPDIAAGLRSFGIGYQSLEKNAGLTLGYRFVKIDGVAPTLENAWNGDYDQVYFLSYNHRENDFRAGAARPALLAGEAGILESLIDTGFDISPAVASQINSGFPHAFGEGAFLVSVAPGAAPAAFDPNNPAVPFGRRNSGGTAPDSCAPIYRRTN